MSFIDKLRIGHTRLLSMIHEDGHDDILLMTYAEYSLQCFVIYKDAIYHDILHENGALAQAFLSIGVEQPRDQLLILLDTLYLALHTKQSLN